MIGIVILNYNTYSDTIRLVRELQQQSLAYKLRVVVVDNASPNESYDMLKPLEQKFSNVNVLQTGKNLGYAKGNNFGLKYLNENVNPEYVAILNNDVFLASNCFEQLCHEYKELDNPGIIAPMIEDWKVSEKIEMCNIESFFVDLLKTNYVLRSLHYSLRPRLTDNTGRNAMKVEMICGSFMFTSFATFKKIGNFYPNTFLYLEERFIATKLLKLGLSSYVLLNQSYIHAHSKTIDSLHNKVSKYKMFYSSLLEYTSVCRSHGKLKAAILKPFMKYSLFELKVVMSICSLSRKKNERN